MLGETVEGGVRLGGRRVRVSARDDDAARDEHVDQLERALELRRERHVRHATCGEEPFEQRAVGIAPCGREQGLGSMPWASGKTQRIGAASRGVIWLDGLCRSAPPDQRRRDAERGRAHHRPVRLTRARTRW